MTSRAALIAGIQCKMWPSLYKPPICRILLKLRLIHHQRAHLLLMRMVLFFFHWAFLCKVISFWMRTVHKLISITRGTYNVRKFWMHRTSGLVRCRTIAWKYAYKNLMLYSGSRTHSVVMHVRSSARDWSSCIDYWTWNSHNVNSVFAVNRWFIQSRSQMFDLFSSNLATHKLSLALSEYYTPQIFTSTVYALLFFM